MEYDVTKDREKYIGGSDIPIIMGLSKFKTRWQLMQEKAGLAEIDHTENAYTKYGHEMESIIRQHMSITEFCEFEPDRKIHGKCRYHADGYCRKHKVVLEIKTTSHIYETLQEYKAYLVQLVWGMHMFNSDDGILAVYKRPDDFNLDFDVSNLQVFYVYMIDNLDLVNEIKTEIKKFVKDVEKLRKNPFMTEQDFIPKELVNASNSIAILEQQIVNMKQVEQVYKNTKAELKILMEKYGIKTWTTPNGTKITLVADGNDTVKEVFDEEKFKADNEDLYRLYLTEKTVKGKAGYVKVTLSKGAEK